jgi:hypothetical protein
MNINKKQTKEIFASKEEIILIFKKENYLDEDDEIVKILVCSGGLKFVIKDKITSEAKDILLKIKNLPPKDVLNKKVLNLELSARLYNILIATEVETIGEFIDIVNSRKILDLRGSGTKTILEALKVLSEDSSGIGVNLNHRYPELKQYFQ